MRTLLLASLQNCHSVDVWYKRDLKAVRQKWRRCTELYQWVVGRVDSFDVTEFAGNCLVDIDIWWVLHEVVTNVFLFTQYGADVRALDHEGRNALWYAKSSRSNECVELLKCQGCPENPTIPRRRTSSQQPPPPVVISITQQHLPLAPPLPPGSNEAFEKLPASVI